MSPNKRRREKQGHPAPLTSLAPRCTTPAPPFLCRVCQLGKSSLRRRRTTELPVWPKRYILYPSEPLIGKETRAKISTYAPSNGLLVCMCRLRKICCFDWESIFSSVSFIRLAMGSVKRFLKINKSPEEISNLNNYCSQG